MSSGNPLFKAHVFHDFATVQKSILKSLPDVIIFDDKLLLDGDSIYFEKREIPFIPLVGSESDGQEWLSRGAIDYALHKKINFDFLGRLSRYAFHWKGLKSDISNKEERYKSIVENSSDILTLVSPQGIILYESPAIMRIFGYDPRQLVGRSVFEFVHPKDRDVLQTLFLKSSQEKILDRKVEFRFMGGDKEWHYLEAIGSTILDEKDGAIALISSRDVTERVKYEKKLMTLSLEDALTGLLNRRGFVTLGNQQFKLSKRTKQGMALISRI